MSLLTEVDIFVHLQMSASSRERLTFRVSHGSLTAVHDAPVRTPTMVTTGVTMPAQAIITSPLDAMWSTREANVVRLSIASLECSIPPARTSTPLEMEV